MVQQLTLGPQEKFKVKTLAGIEAKKKKHSIKEKRAKLPKILQFITSPKLTAAAAGLSTLGSTANPLLATGAYFSTATALGIIESSSKAEEFAGKAIKDPTKFGGKVGEVIEDPSKFKGEILAGLGLVAAGGTAYVVGKDLLTDTTEELEKEIDKETRKRSKKELREIKDQLKDSVGSGNPMQPVTSVPVAAPIPPTAPESQLIDISPRSARKKHKKKQAPRQTIRQSVVININQQKKYLNRVCFV